MAATLLTTQTIDRTGEDPDALAETADATNGNTFTCDNATALYLSNAGGFVITATLAFPTANYPDGRTVSPPTLSVPAGERRLWGPWPLAYYADTTNNNYATITYSAAGLKVMAYKHTTS